MCIFRLYSVGNVGGGFEDFVFVVEAHIVEAHIVVDHIGHIAPN